MAPAVRRLKLQQKWLLGEASVEVAADAESHKKAPTEVAGAVSVEVSADEKTFFGSVAAEVAASVASAKGGRWCRSRKVALHQWRWPLMHPAEK